MFRRNVLGLLQCNRRLTRPYAVNRRSASSSSSQLPPNPKTVEEIPSLVSQIRESFSHGDGAFYGVSAVGFVSAALLLERWSSCKFSERDYTVPMNVKSSECSAMFSSFLSYRQAVV